MSRNPAGGRPDGTTSGAVHRHTRTNRRADPPGPGVVYHVAWTESRVEDRDAGASGASTFDMGFSCEDPDVVRSYVTSRRWRAGATVRIRVEGRPTASLRGEIACTPEAVAAWRPARRVLPEGRNSAAPGPSRHDPALARAALLAAVRKAVDAAADARVIDPLEGAALMLALRDLLESRAASTPEGDPLPDAVTER